MSFINNIHTLESQNANFRTCKISQAIKAWNILCDIKLCGLQPHEVVKGADYTERFDKETTARFDVPLDF